VAAPAPPPKVVVYFATRLFVLDQRTRRTLAKVVPLLTGEFKLSIGGHSDDRGKDTFNDKLSRQRAEAVASYFRRRGIPMERMRYRGYGSSQPADRQDTPQAWQHNRRVEISIEKVNP